MASSCDTDERWIPVRWRVAREYVFTSRGVMENTAAIGTFREISVSEADLQRATRDLQRRRAEGVAYGIQTPDGSELVAVGRKAYHRWMTRFQDKFGPEAEFRIRSIRLKPSTKA
jgi:hypothetical protein